MIRRRGHGSKTSLGQAMVEFAFAFPIFIVLLLGLIEGGRFVFYSEVLNHAAREGARYAIIHGENAEPPKQPTGPNPSVAGANLDPTGEAVKEAVRAAAVSMPASEIIIPDPVYSPPKNTRGTDVTVSAQYTYTPIVPVFGSITVGAEATLVINN